MGCTNSKSGIINPKNQSLKLTPGTFLSRMKGKLSNNYNLLKKLGSGAFADVQLCLYKPLNQRRAVKIIHKAGLHHQQMDEEYMLKEISILMSLDHPNILKCYEIFEDNWKFYVAMEYCAGGELFDKILELKRFSEIQASEILFQLLSAISYCHSKGVIHRDLKPENILMEDKQEGLSIKVADFGSSCFIDKKKKLSGCFGSAYYVAPEVLEETYNEKCDIWSLGVIMFILLTGKPPYDGRDERAILEQVQHNPLHITRADWPNVSEEAIDLLQKMLVVNPRNRIPAKEALDHRWIRLFRTMSSGVNLTNTLQDLSLFSGSAKLRNAVHMFLASQAISHEELKVLKKSFIELDRNSDGKLSKEELLQEYLKTMDEEHATEIVEKIMKEVDVNQSGDIDYTEFLIACMNQNNYSSKNNLETAFALFDKDSSGEITIKEIKAVLGTSNFEDNQVWNEIIKEVDQNNDGVIDLKEFMILMSRRF